jgi:putative Mg2+ transporter-C (MgtC) family protein
MDLNWQVMLDATVRILLAYALALPIGWERERERTSGVRTFPLVAMASCGYVLLGSAFAPPATIEAQARIVQGLITGIGFIGAGAILKGSGSVHGTATAASLWNTGVIGAAVAMGRIEIAVVLSVLNLLTLRLLLRMKPHARKEQEQP